MAWYRICNDCGGVIDSWGCCSACDEDFTIHEGHFECYGQDTNSPDRNYFMSYGDSLYEERGWCMGRWEPHKEHKFKVWVCGGKVPYEPEEDYEPEEE